MEGILWGGWRGGLVRKRESGSIGKLSLETGVLVVNLLEKVTSRSGCCHGSDYEKESRIVGLGVLDGWRTWRPPGTRNWECEPIANVLGKWGGVIDRMMNTATRKMGARGTSLVVQQLRLHTFTAGGTCSIPGWGTKIPHAPRCGRKRKKDGSQIEWISKEMGFAFVLVLLWSGSD